MCHRGLGSHPSSNCNAPCSNCNALLLTRCHRLSHSNSLIDLPAFSFSSYPTAATNVARAGCAQRRKLGACGLVRVGLHSTNAWRGEHTVSHNGDERGESADPLLLLSDLHVPLSLPPDFEIAILATRANALTIGAPVDSVHLVRMAWQVLEELLRLHLPHLDGRVL